jgi:hypothetical protein
MLPGYMEISGYEPDGGSLPNKPVLTRYMEKSGYESG